MKIIKDIIPISASKRPGRFGEKKGFTVHSTGNKNSTARNERDYLTNPNNKNYASYNYVVDDKEAIECIPWNEVSYHAGNREGNWNTIGIEMCESGDRNKVISNTINLIIKLHKEHRVPLNLYRHYDWPMVENGYRYRKNCPRILNYNNWQGWVEFKTLLKTRMEGSSMNDKRVREIVREEMDKVNKDESVASWAKSSVEALKDKEIMTGYTDGTYRPKVSVTREGLAVVIDRAINSINDDSEDVSSWAEEAVDYVQVEGIMEGYDDETWKPNKPVTRAELATVIYRISKK